MVLGLTTQIPMSSQFSEAMTIRRPATSSDAVKKVILLGNSGVGKTSLANRWIMNDFEPDVAQTIGPRNTLRDVEVHGRQVKVALWDTAGQEQYRAIAPLYIRGARSACLVASLDSPESFEALSTWLELLNSSQDNPVMSVLAVNKVDLADPTDPEVGDLVDPHRAKFSATFFVSARTGEGVDAMFREVARLANEAQALTDNRQAAPEFSQIEETKKGCC
jgi:small GTP-binding protein